MSMTRTDHIWSWTDDVLPFVALFTVTCLDIVVLTIVKAAMNDGLGSMVYVIYHNALGTFILLPFFMVHIIRTSDRPPLTFGVLFRFFVLGLLGICLFQVLWFVGVDYTSPTMASAIGNLFPGITFMISIFFRIEKIDMRNQSSVAKILGTTAAITGAMVFTFYQGQEIFVTPNSPNQLFLSHPSSWVFGALITLTSVTFGCTWIVLHTITVKEYPDRQTIVFFYGLFGTIQCIALSPFLERNRRAWLLQPGIRVIAVVLGAVYSSAVRNSILTWCFEKKGPVYAAMFSPLSIVLAVILGVTFLGDTLYLGSVIGATIVAVGFYMVLWGQTKEKNKILVVKDDNMDLSESSADQTTLLLSRVNESEC